MRLLVYGWRSIPNLLGRFWQYWNSHISAAVRAISMTFDACWCISTFLTSSTVKNFQFRKSKMTADAILKNRKSPYLGHSWNDFDKIWHNDAVPPSWPFWPLKNWNFGKSRLKFGMWIDIHRSFNIWKFYPLVGAFTTPRRNVAFLLPSYVRK